jgi:hypothetical protein
MREPPVRFCARRALSSGRRETLGLEAVGPGLGSRAARVRGRHAESRRDREDGIAPPRC